MTTTHHLDLPVPGINCAGCAGRVTRALTPLPGIEGVAVNPATRRASMRLRGGSLDDVRRALDDAGYPPDLSETRLALSGLSCAACAGRVRRALTDHPLVAEAEVNLASHQARITHAPGLAPTDLARICDDLGYPARVAGGDAPAADPDRDEARTLRRAAITAALLTLPVFAIEMGGHAVPALHHWLHGLMPMRAIWAVQMVLTLAVLAGPGRRFFRTGLAALRRGAPEMNSLVALGAGAAFVFSAVVTIAPGLVPPASRHVWFEAAAVIVTLILTGRWLEARARGQAGAAIRALVALAPDHATRLRDGRPERVAVADLRPGDDLLLQPGDRVALDGIVTEGQGHLDESMLTGEPLPVAKSPGDRVTGGTVNGMTALSYRVTAVGRDTVLARIVAMVDRAQAARLPVQDLVDRITRVFVPVVIGLAAVTFLAWLAFGPGLAHAVVAAVSVLIIACPCAMGLAVPVSIMVGSGRGAQLGLLFRRGEALQRLARARVVAFDKTGTLTVGRPRVTAVHLAGTTREAALRLAAAAEARSEHPLAAAILAEAEGLPLPEAQDVTARPGRGLTARVEGRSVTIGNLEALADAGIAPDPDLIARARADADQGATAVHLAVDGRHCASLSLADPERPEAAGAVARLRAMGLGVAMLSGDQPATARAVGDRLGIADIQAGLTPADKLDRLRALGPDSVFVGDGINDAPALAAAGTGIAIGTGTDVAIESADAVLISGDPAGVARAVALSRAVMRTIRQNLFWAFAYNIALIPVAMGALVPFGGPQLSPMLGAGAMALSSVFVVGNALRLRTAA
ncbi:copper-translocating P-type ATPase [Paracoccus aestuarii]|uniref:Copper-translocating P-type ATPase n=1 Tax=Paracoccus aestuarii TaxID=453842 RepID=A0A418ZY21_9RHOB|nr:heavy metal translocating P-type ATPase [Paracoccus aestuarii]RJL05398.1 copper-translocating P-type ATPase [Paracoccus aestuarii]WCQ99758.1 copper-translocating P-type ATPase [Paracoccus aestuarii]